MPSPAPTPRSFELLLEEALELSPSDRARLASNLLESLKERRNLLGHQQWIAEMEERAQAALAGQPGRTWTQTRLEISRRMHR